MVEQFYHFPYAVQVFNPHDYSSGWKKHGALLEKHLEAYEVWQDLLDTPTETYPMLYRVINVDTKTICFLGMRTCDRDQWGEQQITVHVLKREVTGDG